MLQVQASRRITTSAHTEVVVLRYQQETLKFKNPVSRGMIGVVQVVTFFLFESIRKSMRMTQVRVVKVKSD